MFLLSLSVLSGLFIYLFILKGSVKRVKVVDVIQELKNIGRQKTMNFEDIYLSADGSFLTTKLTDSDVTVIFSTEKDITNQVSSLQKIMKSSTIFNKNNTTVDFRFDKIVIK